MVVESDTIIWFSGFKRWRFYAGSIVEDFCGIFYKYVVIGSSFIGVVSFGIISFWGGVLEDVLVVAIIVDIVLFILIIFKVIGIY